MGALPRFTLHDHTHLENVLYWMEQFVTPEGWSELGPVGSAMCIVLACTHDLGMVPEPRWEEHINDSESREFADFHRFDSEKHPGLLDLWEHLLTSNADGDGDKKRRADKGRRADWIHQCPELFPKSAGNGD